MIYQNKKELAKALDEVINKFISLNISITDTKNEHHLMVFMLERKGYKLRAVSPTRKVKSVSIDIDDIFGIDEHLQDLHTYASDSINQSKRYNIDYGV
jgi:hypothetical protein